MEGSKITIAGREYCLITVFDREPGPNGSADPISSSYYEYISRIGNEDIGISFSASWGVDGKQVNKEARLLFEQILATFKPTSSTAQTSDSQTAGWKTYSNIQFNYKFLYPPNPNGHLSSNLNDFATDTDMDVQSEVEFGVEGVATLLGVSMSWQKQLLSPNDLKSFANSVREMQVTDPDPNNSADRKIGPLKETTLGGTKAYSFTLTDSFRDEGGGYTLGNKSEYIYVIAQNPQGQKVVLHYLAGSADAERMAQSFEFTK